MNDARCELSIKICASQNPALKVPGEGSYAEAPGIRLGIMGCRWGWK